MVGRQAMLTGLIALAEAFGIELKDQRAEIYIEILSPHFTDAEWAATVHATLRTARFFPSIAELLEAAPTSARTEQDALVAYERIADLGDDAKWNFRHIRESLGEAAAQAFIESGGFNAFSWCSERDEPFRRKAFVAAYRAASKGALALPAAAEPKRIAGRRA